MAEYGCTDRQGASFVLGSLTETKIELYSVLDLWIVTVPPCEVMIGLQFVAEFQVLTLAGVAAASVAGFAVEFGADLGVVP